MKNVFLSLTVVMSAFAAQGAEVKFRCERLDQSTNIAAFTRIDLSFSQTANGLEVGKISSLDRVADAGALPLKNINLADAKSWGNASTGNYKNLTFIETNTETLGSQKNIEQSIYWTMYKHDQTQFLVPVENTGISVWNSVNSQPLFYISKAIFAKRANLTTFKLYRVLPLFSDYSVADVKAFDCVRSN